MGTADLAPAKLIYQYSAVFLSSLGLSIGAVQIIFQILFLMGAGFSMFFLSRTVYPNHELAPLISGLFYMLNFFVLQSRLNLGFVWTYALLPLLIALLIKAIETAYQPEHSGKSNCLIIFLAVATMAAFSLASINPANIALMLLALFVVTLYELVKYRKNLKPLIFALFKILLVSVLVNLWWLLPFLYVYYFSPEALNPQVNVASWWWTQSRASFVNLFWFNGIWGWLPDYVPYISDYSNNPLLQLLVFVPFIVGVSALLFRGERSRFNAYVMLSILGFIFLAKGLHEPFSQVNAALYNYVPLMNMFREPTSKFTMLIVLFMSLLIGYAAARLANLRINRHNRLLKVGVPVFLIAVFVLASFPLVTNPLETKTDYLPYSSYVKIPDYWYNAANWINEQEGDYALLFTPLDDFYQMPYTWGYYGVDNLFYDLFNKPIISFLLINPICGIMPIIRNFDVRREG
jgi:arabinofuranan 3-O-arabinosyltransferase